MHTAEAPATTHLKQTLTVMLLLALSTRMIVFTHNKHKHTDYTGNYICRKTPHAVMSGVDTVWMYLGDKRGS